MELSLKPCKQNEKRKLACSLFTGIIFGICLVFGYYVEKYHAVPYGSLKLYLIVLFISLFITGIVYGIFTWLERKKYQTILEEKIYTLKQKLVRILFYSGVIFIGWIPSFLGVYPGWFNYDGPWQLSMWKTQEISSHHPVLHTVVMGEILERMSQIYGTYNKGIALYMVLQMAVLALCFGFSIYYLDKKRVGKIGRSIAIFWFVLFPTIVLHVMSVTKDSLFAGFLLVFCIFTYELLKKPEIFLKSISKIVIWILLLFLCIVFRQNSFYAFCIASIPFIIMLRKYWKTVLVMLFSVCVLIALYNGPFYKALSVTKGSKVEFLSVPSQQIVKVYLDEEENLTIKEKQTIEKFFAAESFVKYRPKIADFTKNYLKENILEKEKKEFVDLYFSLLKKYPEIYMDAFLLTNYGFWYPDATIDIYENGVSYYFATEHVPPAVTNSKIPFLLKYYKEFYTGFPVQDSGVLTWILSMALYFYFLIFTFANLLYKKKSEGIFVCSVIILIWLTYLLGPVALTRYVFFLYVLLPLEYVMLAESNNSGTKVIASKK